MISNGFNFLRRSFNTSSETIRFIFLFGISIIILSPFSTSAILPPFAASGQICPTQIPLVPPEKRPSVIRAAFVPKPLPTRSEVGASISLIPGEPFGPSYLITITSPSLISLFSSANIDSSSESNTFALPSK